MKFSNCFLLATFCMFLFSCARGKKAKENVQTLTESVSTEQEESEDRGYIVKVGDIAPDFTFTTTTGETIQLSDLRGRVVMLQFTASWCSVCRKEMPDIERLIWQKHKENPNFALYGIDRDEPLETVKEFAIQTGITYPLALDPGADIFALYANREAGITRNVIVNREGQIVMLTRLYDEDEFVAMCKKIDELLI